MKVQSQKKEPRQGKENVIRQMFFDIEADYYLMVDGDDTYPAKNAQEMIQSLREDRAYIVIANLTEPILMKTSGRLMILVKIRLIVCIKQA